MKEIKFRGKRIDNGEWIYGQLYQFTPEKYKDILDNRAWISLRIESMTTKNGGITVSFIEIDPKTVGQFTGLRDMNEIEVYEGDIVGCIYADHIYENIVTFENFRFCFIEENKCISPIENWIRSYTFKVINNIY